MYKFSLARILALLVAICILAVQFSSCGSLMTASAADLMEGIEANAVSGKETDEDFKAAMADFAVELFKNSLDKDKGSSLVSPLSVVLAMAMVTNGADKNTKAELEAVFGMPIDELNEYLYAYVNNLSSTDEARVKLANSIWILEGFNVTQSFLQTNADYYNAQAYRKNFGDPATADEINAWVKGHTDEMIEKIIDNIDADTVMFLINALVFDAKWQVQYDNASVKDGIFHSYNGKNQSVQFMSSEENYFIECENAAGFVKNYAGGNYSFAAILPDEGIDVYDFIKSISGDDLLGMLETRRPDRIKASIPKFTYDYDITLNEALQNMGISEAFTGKADFSKLDPMNGVYISKVIHKTHIEVTQSGTRAAAVTAVVLETKSAPLPPDKAITLDRPFVYCIIDNNTNLPIFIGVVTNIG